VQSWTVFTTLVCTHAPKNLDDDHSQDYMTSFVIVSLTSGANTTGEVASARVCVCVFALRGTARNSGETKRDVSADENSGR
jgi:hypothetical protein